MSGNDTAQTTKRKREYTVLLYDAALPSHPAGLCIIHTRARTCQDAITAATRKVECECGPEADIRWSMAAEGHYMHPAMALRHPVDAHEEEMGR